MPLIRIISAKDVKNYVRYSSGTEVSILLVQTWRAPYNSVVKVTAERGKPCISPCGVRQMIDSRQSKQKLLDSNVSLYS